MPDTEKVTINMSAVDLGKVDLLVQEGLYSNRTDFIRAAIRSQIDKHHVEVQQSIARHSYVIGVVLYARSDFERLKAKGERLKISIVGLLNLAEDIPGQLADEVIESIKVHGVFNASPEVKAALAKKLR